mmetsp:Transcript_19672/g.58338  ORF Transcript_19672/g.58338 Transcript_19672/m.58338 type:complete len:206 (+) Transcript_19672:325-942(+)
MGAALGEAGAGCRCVAGPRYARARGCSQRAAAERPAPARGEQRACRGELPAEARAEQRPRLPRGRGRGALRTEEHSTRALVLVSEVVDDAAHPVRVETVQELLAQVCARARRARDEASRHDAVPSPHHLLRRRGLCASDFRVRRHAVGDARGRWIPPARRGHRRGGAAAARAPAVRRAVSLPPPLLQRAAASPPADGVPRLSLGR